MADVLDVILGLERFFEVRLVQSEEVARVMIFGGRGKVMAFLVECCACGCVTVD